MTSVPVVVKHQGKKYEVEIDTTSNGETFKYQLFSLTGVEPERQKILLKGGQLKDDTELSKFNIKPGHIFMMMGTPSGDGTVALEKPKEKIRFLEDMTEAEAAQTIGAIPPGLVNLGNTCYMNSTIQALKAIPELHESLLQYSGGGDSSSSSTSNIFGFGSAGTDLTGNLRDLFKQMAQTQESVTPAMFLNALRVAYPQFAQRARDGHGYAQQDAEEAWSQILSQLRQKVKVKESVVDGATSEGQNQTTEVAFVDKYMAGGFESTMECDEPEAKEKGEKATESKDTFFKLNCHITAETNHLRDGLVKGLKEQIEKKSTVLDRDAVYTKTSRISRLPKYLTVHFMRFDWRKDTSKKAKIMRKVTFPQELDTVEFCTEELKSHLVPVRDKIREIRKEEEDIERAKKRQKKNRDAGLENDAGSSKSADSKSKSKSTGGKKPDGDTEMADVVYKTDAEVEAERAALIRKAKEELLALVDPKAAADESINHTGLYELRGIITHQGASADSGHYTAFVKKQGRKDPKTGEVLEEDGKWWWFNDEKVSEFEPERIETLSGGGQSHSALVLLYRAVPLPTLDAKENGKKALESGDVKMSE